MPTQPRTMQASLEAKPPLCTPSALLRNKDSVWSPVDLSNIIRLFGANRSKWRCTLKHIGSSSYFLVPQLNLLLGQARVVPTRTVVGPSFPCTDLYPRHSQRTACQSLLQRPFAWHIPPDIVFPPFSASPFFSTECVHIVKDVTCIWLYPGSVLPHIHDLTIDVTARIWHTSFLV